MKYKELLLIGIVFIGSLIRVYKLTESPAGLYIDETSIGYNAWSLLTTGKDEHGKPWPIFFEAFGEYKLPVYVYAVVVSEFIFGPTDFAVRLPAVVFGTLTIPVIFFLAREVLRESKGDMGKRGMEIVPLLSSFLLALSPWHFQFTHAGFEASSGIFFLVSGLFLFFKAVNQHSGRWLVASIISLVMTLYSYNSARIVTPLLLLSLMILYRKRFFVKNWLIVLTLGLIMSLPFLRFGLSPQGFARAQQVSILYQAQTRPWGEVFLENYWKNLSPETLFIKGEPTIAHLTPHRMSLLYPLELPFMIIGLISLISQIGRRQPAFAFMFIWFLVGFVPPAITTLNPHALRASLAIPAAVMISAFGFGWMIGRIRRIGLIWFVSGIYVMILVVSAGRFLSVYHTRYTRDSGWDWQVGIRRVSFAIQEYGDGYRYYFSEAGPARISFLWYLKIHPENFLAQPDKNMVPPYYFAINSLEDVPQTGTSLYITAESDMEKPIETIYYPNESVAYYVYRR